MYKSFIFHNQVVASTRIHTSKNQPPNSQVVHAMRISCGDLPLGITKFQQPSSVSSLTFSHIWSSENTFVARSNIYVLIFIKFFDARSLSLFLFKYCVSFVDHTLWLREFYIHSGLILSESNSGNQFAVTPKSREKKGRKCSKFKFSQWLNAFQMRDLYEEMFRGCSSICGMFVEEFYLLLILKCRTRRESPRDLSNNGPSVPLIELRPCVAFVDFTNITMEMR